MTKQEFMYRLAQQLISLPPEERVCALKFYDEYFADAGPEQEEAVAQELGSPEAVAQSIKRDFAERNPGYDQGGQQSYRPGPQYHPGSRARGYTTTNPGQYGDRGQPQGFTRQGMSGGAVALLVVLLVLGSPLWISLLAVLFGLVLAVFGVVFALVVAAGAVAVGLLAGGIAAVVAGAGSLVISPAAGLLGLGLGLVTAGAGCLVVAFCVWLAAGVVPPVVRWVVDLCRRPFHREGGAQR